MKSVSKVFDVYANSVTRLEDEQRVQLVIHVKENSPINVEEIEWWYWNLVGSNELEKIVVPTTEGE